MTFVAADEHDRSFGPLLRVSRVQRVLCVCGQACSVFCIRKQQDIAGIRWRGGGSWVKRLHDHSSFT